MPPEAPDNNTPFDFEHQHTVNQVAFSGDGRHVATGSRDQPSLENQAR